MSTVDLKKSLSMVHLCVNDLPFMTEYREQQSEQGVVS